MTAQLETFSEARLEAIEAQIDGVSAVSEIWQGLSSLDDRQAYALQVQLAAHRGRRGDPVIGYKAAYTAPDAPGGPRVGTLRQDHMLASGDVVPLSGATLLEAEIAVRLGRDCPGGVDRDAVRDMIEALMPSFEIVPMLERRSGWSRAQWIVANKIGGHVVLGAPVCDPAMIDLVLEQVTLVVDDGAEISGSGALVMGDPMDSVRFVADTLARAGGMLEAGSVVITGAMTRPVMLDGSEARARADFSSLGRIAVDFHRIP
ncbi:hypothetical protein COO09_09025 [Rhizorhabdus dicambivorans]|uniref:Fumarylacetoacetase-like C-terminal domain-containing protein n=2 Tax=Rhizorhabdus dicambivorans TaxID=1850238 RepID=A0A2A4FUU5_9SPHN|nr:fumarylacetoacetate hydrolase family protein [Rhizorhabdus dicambivorans]PCE42551.1 hypothetical protein COO09_09025 [Rhizorhabdus dicambivorans]